MFRFLKRRKMMWALMALALGSSAAFAVGRGPGPGCGAAHGEFIKARLDAHVADLVELTKATPEQQKALEAARDRIAARMQAQRRPGPQPQGQGQGQRPGQGKDQGQAQEPRAAHHRELRALFLSDTPDPRQIEVLRDQHLQHRGEVAQGMIDELGVLHGIFNRDQRKAIAGYLQDLSPDRRGPWRARMGQFMATRMVGHLAEAIKASPEQKKALVALADKAGELRKTHHHARQQLAEKALALWQGERWEPAQAQALQKAQQGQDKADVDAAIRLGLEAHKLLTPDQRKAAAEFIGRRGPGGRGFGPHRHGPHGYGPQGGFGGAPEDEE